MHLQDQPSLLPFRSSLTQPSSPRLRRAVLAPSALLAACLVAGCTVAPIEDTEAPGAELLAEQDEATSEAASALQVDDCGRAHATPGCNDAPVQACVCAADPFCCNTQWDSICAGEVTSLACVPPATRAFGRLSCSAPDGAGTVLHPVAHVTFEIPGHGAVTTDQDGAFDFPVTPIASAEIQFEVTWDGTVTSSSVSTPLQVMDDLHNAHTGQFIVTGNLRSDRSIDLGNVSVSSVDCELWRLGVDVLRDYHVVKGAPPPAGRLRIKRWNGVDVGTPYAFHDYVVIRNDFTTAGNYAYASVRESTLFHEFGHTVRHAADGDLDHWNFDNFRWAYARDHDGTMITNVQFAFNEGWAGYWSSARYGHRSRDCTGATPGCDVPTPDFRDWNESLITNRLLDLADLVGDKAMVEVLEAHPGEIHSLHDFEVALAGSHAEAPAPVPVAPCPPGFNDDGATCSSTVSKPSYGRGAGAVPRECGPGRELDAGLCYPLCASGYDGVGPVCWQICPAGYTDDGATCRRDARIINADNASCPWYDKCGLTFAKGCSVCPSGYTNDGCTCRIDAHIFGKSSYGRGAGTVPAQCGGGQEYDAGLCYPACSAGFDGVGPVCWGSCPNGYRDDGALCTVVIVQ